MLTPAFHFKILQDFLDVMNKHCDKLCDDILAPLANQAKENILQLKIIIEI